MSTNGLLSTILAGSFFIVGFIISLVMKKQEKLINFVTGMAFVVMIILAVFELNAEAMESFNTYYSNRYISLGLLVLSILIGVVIIKLIDRLIPHHNHYEEEKTHNNHLYHIGMITFVSLMIHNLIEGMSIYNLGTSDFQSGLLIAIAIGLHNLPFGVQIGAIMNQEKKTKKQTPILILGLFLSTIIGGLLMGLVGEINELVNGVLIGITLGMVIYLIIFELLVEIKESHNKLTSYLGMATGVVIMVISSLL